MKEALTILENEMERLNIPYTFDSWDNEIELPQFIGEILETPTVDEDGKSEYSFILTGYATTYSYLFDVADLLKSNYKTKTDARHASVFKSLIKTIKLFSLLQ